MTAGKYIKGVNKTQSNGDQATPTATANLPERLNCLYPVHVRRGTQIMLSNPSQKECNACRTLFDAVLQRAYTCSKCSDPRPIPLCYPGRLATAAQKLF